MTELETFQAYRPLLFSIAYRMLGSAEEADDVLQEAYLRFRAGSQAPLRSPKAFLTTIVTRLCLDHLKSARSTREQYIGPWLPEPLLTNGLAGDPQQAAERYESISLAFLVLLERLTPQERAVLLLREVFEYEYEEIASMLAISVANCRQILHRARERVARERPRFDASPDQQRRLVERFLAATQQGDVQSLISVLAEDVSYVADGGGKVPSARKPIRGRERVARLLIALARGGPEALKLDPREIVVTVEVVNAEPAVLVWAAGELDNVMVCSISEGHISAIRVIRNPDKLAYIQRQMLAGGA